MVRPERYLRRRLTVVSKDKGTVLCPDDVRLQKGLRRRTAHAFIREIGRVPIYNLPDMIEVNTATDTPAETCARLRAQDIEPSPVFPENEIPPFYGGYLFQSSQPVRKRSSAVSTPPPAAPRRVLWDRPTNFQSNRESSRSLPAHTPIPP